MKKTDPLFGYRFSDPSLAALAYTHPSCERPEGDNQRLEFLGDAVLSLLVAERLYRRFPDAAEGALDHARASVVNGQSLAALARRIGLAERIEVSESHRRQHPEPSAAMLEDCLEALVGAIYLDGGLEAAGQWVESALGERLAEAEAAPRQRNAKSRLQEWSQAQHAGAVPEYAQISAEGPDHERFYEVVVSLLGKECGRGRGRSIKRAETAAAEAALRRLEEDA